MGELIFYAVIAILWIVFKSWSSGRKQAAPAKRAAPAEPQTRRAETAPPPSIGPSPRPTAEKQPANLEDMLKRLMGMEEETEEEMREAQPEAAPPPLVRPAQNYQPQMARSMNEANTPPIPDPGCAAPLPPQPTGMAAMRANAALATVSKPKPAASVFAQRLRGNPAALQEAFVYAEVFGRPAADR